jgi:hypothetical protein
MDLAQRSHHALTECEASLAASWGLINQERLDHRASQEALTFERERHKETLELLELVFKEAVRCGEIADRLGSQVAALQSASNSGIVQAVPQAIASMEAPLGEESSIPSTASIPANQQRESVERLPETCAGSSPKPKHLGEDEGQQAGRKANVDSSDGLEHKHCFPPHVPLQSIESRSSSSSVTLFASAMEGVDGHKRSKTSSAPKKRARLPTIKELSLN